MEQESRVSTVDHHGDILNPKIDPQEEDARAREEPKPSEERYEEELSEEALRGLENGLKGLEQGLEILRGMKHGRRNGTSVVSSMTTGNKMGFSFSFNVGQSPPNRKRKWVKSDVKEEKEPKRRPPSDEDDEDDELYEEFLSIELADEEDELDEDE